MSSSLTTIHSPAAISSLCILSKIAEAKHAKEIAKLVSDAFSARDVFRKEGQQRTSPEAIIKDMEAGHQWTIGLINNQIVAAMLITVDSLTAASVHMLAVHKDYFGKKLGAVLLGFAETFAQEKGLNELNLEVAHVNDRLMAYYKKQGFVITGEPREYFSPEDQKAYLKEEFQGPGKLLAVTLSKDLTKQSQDDIFPEDF